MNTTAAIQSAAKSTQAARRNYFAAIASDAPAWLVEARAAALRIATDRLVRECGGSQRKAQAAEVSYLESLVAA